MTRLDAFLVEQKLVETRSRSADLIRRGKVLVNGKVIAKPAYDVPAEAEIKINEQQWVSRGALKLEHAFDIWKINVEGMKCLDIGASTGGFTEVLLSHGASKVFAFDVGHDQLHPSLLENEKVISREGLHVRDMTTDDTDGEVDFICVDVSFIPLTSVLPKVFEILKNGGEAVVLAKPQFEVGKDKLTKSGIVKREEDVKLARDGVARRAESLGFKILGIDESPILGGDGNKEFLLWVGK